MTKNVQVSSPSDLLEYLVSKYMTGDKDWFGFTEQRITGIYLAHEIARYHADKMTPKQVVEYARQLNNEIYYEFIKMKS